MLASTLKLDKGGATYATAADYCRMFMQEMPGLYVLALLLTADKDRARQCFIDGLGESVDRNGIAIERACSWTRRMIIKQAIRMVRPTPEGTATDFFVSVKPSATSNLFAAIASLCAFERFIFVMSVLEGQSDKDCQSLLRCSPQQVLIAREAGLKLVAAVNPYWGRSLVGNDIWPAPLH